jgi:hypothetical protein
VDNRTTGRVSFQLRRATPRASLRKETPVPTRKTLSERARAAIEEVALAAELPDGVTDVILTCVDTQGEKLPTGDPAGKGGTAQFGPAWVIHGREQSAPIALYGSHEEAAYLYELLTGPEGELWQRKERRRTLIAEAEAREAAEALEAKVALKAQNGGGGSPRPKRSSGKRTTRQSSTFATT